MSTPSVVHSCHPLPLFARWSQGVSGTDCESVRGSPLSTSRSTQFHRPIWPARHRAPLGIQAPVDSSRCPDYPRGHPPGYVLIGTTDQGGTIHRS